MNYEEFEISVPWGTIAGKAWGDKENQPVLVLHGIMDNAGSFDRLISLLPSSFYYICVDLPGHGKSSSFPGFFPIYSLHNLPVFLLIIKHFNYKKWILMGHSLGGHLSFTFAQLYPEIVDKLILLDALHIYPTPSEFSLIRLRAAVDFCVNFEHKSKTSKPRSFTYEEVMAKVQYRAYADLTKEAAAALIPRVIRPADEDGKFFLTVDQRLKYWLDPFYDIRYIIETYEACPITCQVLHLISRDNQMQFDYFSPFIEFLQSKPNHKLIYIDGNHDVHNNEPEKVSPHVIKFLFDQNSKL